MIKLVRHILLGMCMKFKINVVNGFFLLCFALSNAAMASNTAGSIKSLNGDVTIKRGVDMLTPQLGTEIMSADELVTGAASSVGVTMLDNTVLTAGEESVLNIESFSYNRKSRRGRMVANVKRGSLSAISGHLAKTSPDDVRFKTATMTLGVRGTEFIIETPSESEGGNTNIILLPDFGGGAGAVQVESLTGETSTIDTAYTQAAISPNGNVTTSLLDILSVIGKFCGLIDAQPPRPKTYLFYFDSSGQNLDASSQQMLSALLSDVGRLQSAEMDIVGYSDTSQNPQDSDIASEKAAIQLKEIIEANISTPLPISVVGRGFRDLLIATPAGIVEARNNRVEVELK